MHLFAVSSRYNIREKETHIILYCGGYYYSLCYLYIFQFQLRREQEEANSMDPATPLTIGHNGNGLSPDNGHLPRSGESHPMVNLRPGSRSPTHVQFSNENGIVGIAQSFWNKSGCLSSLGSHQCSAFSDTSPGAFYPVQIQLLSVSKRLVWNIKCTLVLCKLKRG